MRRGIIVGVLSAALTIGGGCAGSPRWEHVSWQGDEVYVTDEEPEPLYPATPLGGPLAAHDKVESPAVRLFKCAKTTVAIVTIIGLCILFAEMSKANEPSDTP